MGKPIWVESEPLARPCGNVRGGPRSNTKCEKPPGHDGDHVGRSPAGWWFVWTDRVVPKCSVPGCTDAYYSRGCCCAHYWKLRTYGDPLGTSMRPGVEERFWAKVDKRGPDDCWLWTAACFKSGYGQFKPNPESGNVSASRVAWVLTNGPIPDGLQVLHTCDDRYPVRDITNRKCCNPAHLYLGTNKDNVRDKMEHGRHYSPGNNRGKPADALDAGRGDG